MRLLTRRIYRAFPELDRYSDEQCERFVRAARRAFWPRVGRVAARGVGLLVWAGLVILGLWAEFGPNVAENALLMRGVRHTAVVTAGGMVAVLVVPVVGWLVLRDVQLRRRIRRILRARANCPGCGYHLLGLFVNAEHKVVCVECAMETEVDPSLSELVIDESGRRRFNPSPAMPTWWQRKMTARRKRILLRSALGLVALVLLGGPAAWVGYESFLRSQAARAAADRIGAEGMMKIVEGRQPAGAGEGTPNAHESLDEAIVLIERARARLWGNGGPKTPAGHEVIPDVSGVYSAADARLTESQAEHQRYATAAGLMMLKAWEEEGVFEKLREMAARPRAVRTIELPTGGPMVVVLLPTLGPTRNLARGCAARMHLAELAGDDERYVETFESLMALSRVASYQPFLIDDLVGVAIEALGYTRLQPTLADHPSEEWLAGVEGVLARQGSFGQRLMLDGERASALDTTAWLFSDPANVRLRRFSKSTAILMSLGAGGAGGRLGTYEENVRAFNECFDRCQQRAELERWQRPPDPPEDEHPLLLVRTLLPAAGKALQSHDQVELSRRGLRVQIALERYWRRHGRYPERLEELIGPGFEGVPLDPWSGKPLGYKRIDSGTDPLGRGYLLYSFGADGKDDGGMQAQSRWEALYKRDAVPEKPGATGTDFILNDFERAAPLEGLPEIPAQPKRVEPGEGALGSEPEPGAG
ncbi:MAG: hypothetical protein ACK4WH_13495 [Phycisphaerales bacterium]